ncbi:PP2C family protein-serine/threonine phosphatase [Streptomyces spectabilis]|uniref:Serine phosphatase RsbU (Regulator of sigma subunit) n=1 Tax=Streptomyces spectabilis TaxID=68270 RepID=A0A5P2XAB2_STRST|nr:PP2C family protein-serine/threonine phosphatase [Streptomyces spectabilis]MBB5102908.1 serine phosphatase RsbU (regulator of sigma subunit) [Streptomyces spectabilis]MCI3902109.1 serine/threonine-protein phosphatase [Streptomyces spectabilis]QEV59496.1 serine/threonine-protein phosphatase [Streptomyces spectabilis]GGV15933.1 membrane protein [Streptomyces spectabilis]
MPRPAVGRRSARDPDWPSRAPTPPWMRWPAPVLLVLTVVIQVLTPKTLDLSFLLAAVPPLAALAYGPAATALIGGLVLLLLNLPRYDLGHPGESDTATVAFVAVLSVLFAAVRSRRDAQLITVRTVAEAAQFAVLPPLPERVGPVRCAGLYRAAQRGTLVGGDLFDVRRWPGGVRAMVGDVQGHGLAAVGTVAALIGAFREAALDEPDLEGVAARLDRRLVTDAEEAGAAGGAAGGEPGELFATAVLLEFGGEADELRLVSCGHPPPLLLRDGTVAELQVSPGPPLGLGIAGVAPPRETVVGLRPGDWLLTVTDGVTEARDASGAFYPLAARLPALFEAEQDDPAALTDAIWRDLVRFSGGVRDDVALLVFAWER